MAEWFANLSDSQIVCLAVVAIGLLFVLALSIRK